MHEFNIHTVIIRMKLVHTLNILNYEVVKMFGVLFLLVELRLVNLTYLEKAQIVKESAGHITELQ